MICWDHASNGILHLQTTWEFVRCSRPRDRFFSIIWQRDISRLRSPFFLWRLLHGFLATDDALCLKGFCMVSQCVYGWAAKTSRHLFVNCQWVCHIWVHFQWILGMRDIIFLTSHALLLHWRWCAPFRHHLQVLLPCFILWQV